MMTTIAVDKPTTPVGLVSEADLISRYRRRRRIATGVTIGLAVLLIAVGGASVPDFLSVSNMLSVIRAASITGIVAIGLTFVTISGNYFSLSVAQTAILATIVYSTAASMGGFFIGLVAVLVTCLVVGLLQGLVVGSGGNPIVVTLATGAIILALVLVATDGKRVRLIPPAGDSLSFFAQGSPFGVPFATWAFVVVAVLCHLLLKRTTLGRRIVLLGANRLTAVAVGFNVRWLIAAVFVLSAVLAGVAGILTASEFGVADASQFASLDIDAIAAVLVGGTAIKGGQGSILQTTVGVVFIALLNNFLQILGLSTGIRLSLVGAAVVLAVTAYSLIKERSR